MGKIGALQQQVSKKTFVPNFPPLNVYTSRKQIKSHISGEPLPNPGDPALWDPAWKSGPGEAEEEGGAVARQGGQGGQGGGGQVWQGDSWTPLPGGD